MFRRRRRESLVRLLEQREQLAAELAQVDEDAAWASTSDDRLEARDGRELRRQAEALRRSIADLDDRIATARDALEPPGF